MRESVSSERRYLNARDSADEESRQRTKAAKRWNGTTDPPQDDYLKSAQNFYDVPASQNSENTYRKKKAFANLHEYDGIQEIDTVPTAVGFNSMDSLDEIEDAKSRTYRYGMEESRDETEEDETEADQEHEPVTEENDEEGNATGEEKDLRKAMLSEMKTKKLKKVKKVPKKEEKKNQKKDDETVSLLDDDYRYGPRPSGPVRPDGVFLAVQDDDSATCPPLWKSASEEEEEGLDRMMEQAERARALNSVTIPESMYADFTKAHFNDVKEEAAKKEEARKLKEADEAKKPKKKGFFGLRRLGGGSSTASAAPKGDVSKMSSSKTPKSTGSAASPKKRSVPTSPRRKFFGKKAAKSDPEGSVAREISPPAEDENTIAETIVEEDAAAKGDISEKYTEDGDDSKDSAEDEKPKDLLSGFADLIIGGFDTLAHLGYEKPALALFDWTGEAIGDVLGGSKDAGQSVDESNEGMERTRERSEEVQEEEEENSSPGGSNALEAKSLALEQKEEVAKTTASPTAAPSAAATPASPKSPKNDNASVISPVLSISTILVPALDMPAENETEYDDTEASILGLEKKASSSTSKKKKKKNGTKTKLSFFGKLRRNNNNNSNKKQSE